MLRSYIANGPTNGVAGIFFVLILFSSPGFASAEETTELACTPAKIDEFRIAAQTQSEDTEDRYKIMSICPEYRSELALWMSYYYRSRGDYREDLLEFDQQSGSGASERDQLLLKALRGQSSSLYEAEEAKNSPYRFDAEVLLSLARSLVRQFEYKKAREFYLRYLLLKPDDVEIRLELAYTYIWEGNRKQAEKSLMELRSSAKTTSQNRAIEEGLKRMKTTGPKSMEELINSHEHFRAGFERYNNNFYNFGRSTTYIGYFVKGWDLNLAGHVMNSSQYPGAFGLEGSAQKSFNLGYRWSLFAKAGYFMNGHSGVPLVHGLVQKETRSGIGFGFGYYNDALARDVPLPKDGLDWSRSALYFKAQLKKYLEYRLEFRTITGNTSSTDHQVRVTFPLKKNEEGATPLEVYLLAETESFDKGSQYVYTPLAYTALRGGVKYMDHLTDEMDIKLNVEYGPFYESSRSGATLSYGSSANLLGLGGEFHYKLDEDFFGTFKVRFDRTSSDQGTTYASTLFGIGLIWLMGESP